jgi:hypothetical protein
VHGVLFEQKLWAGLADGTVTLAFRRWARPNAKAGGRQRIPGGVLAIDAVDVVDPLSIDDRDARAAGCSSRVELLKELDRFGSGPVYRIAFHYAGPDPRAELRERDALSDAEVDAIRGRLARFDAASPRGPWTVTALHAIADRPEIRAGDLAASLGRDRASFKIDVRKLKELGLTESLRIGYRLSPRGRAYLDRVS